MFKAVRNDSGQVPILQAIRSLLYLTVCTGPDIAQAVGALSKYVGCPTTLHWSAALTSS